MPIVSIPEESFSYYQIAFDKDGSERVDDPDGLISERLQNAIAGLHPIDTWIGFTLYGAQ